ncbi:MAG: prefoldin subunit alpha [Desulfurococcales archaeon]|nr:prefoldin subunit alpha [Desulfurococcales archaeon]
MAGRQPSQEQVVQAYLAQMGVIRSQIEELQSYIAQIEATVANLEAARESIKALKSGREDLLVPGDPGGTVYLQVSPTRRDSVLLHLGLNIYAYIPLDEAVKIVEERREKYRNMAEKLKSELQKLVAQYREFERVLAALQQQTLQAREGKR